MAPSQPSGVRFAVVGLGHFAQTAVLPAFANASDKVKLAALVTGDEEKAQELGKKYHVPAYKYEAYDGLLESGDIDAVYIALPNSQHREYTERAAKKGIHVLCEKPLAYTSEDAQAMIDACKKADVRLMTAYRLHFEEGNLQAIELVHSGQIGEGKLFSSVFTMQVDDGNIRTDKSLGGGPLEDIGIYCINAARYLFKAEPTEVVAFAASSSDPRFQEIPESVSATLRFPGDRLATFVCGFGQANMSEYRVLGTEGVLIADPAYTWHGAIEHKIIIKGKEQRKTYRHRDQVAAELVHFAHCVETGEDPKPSGEEGLIDVRIIEALRKSYEQKKVIKLETPTPKDRPDASQSIERKPSRTPEPVKAKAPSKKK